MMFCVLFGDKCQQETITKAMLKLNRLACLLIANVAPSSPTRGLEIIYNIMPMEILIEKRASEIMNRIEPQLNSSCPRSSTAYRPTWRVSVEW